MFGLLFYKNFGVNMYFTCYMLLCLLIGIILFHVTIYRVDRPCVCPQGSDTNIGYLIVNIQLFAYFTSKDQCVPDVLMGNSPHHRKI